MSWLTPAPASDDERATDLRLRRMGLGARIEQSGDTEQRGRLVVSQERISRQLRSMGRDL